MTVKHAFSGASILFVLASFLPALLGQDADSAPKGKETTVTGCLSKAEGQAQYMLKDEDSGKEMTVTGAADLETHAKNHTVKLTGNMTTDSGKITFNASKVEMVSAT